MPAKVVEKGKKAPQALGSERLSYLIAFANSVIMEINSNTTTTEEALIVTGLAHDAYVTLKTRERCEECPL